MSIDISSIGIGFETSGLDKGTAALDKAGAAANKAATAADKVTNSGMFLSESQRKTKQAMDDASGSIEKQIKAMQQQVALFGMSARQAETYKLALGGATDAQIKQANAALKSVETMERARDMTEKSISAAKYGAAAVAAAVVAAAVVWDKLIGSVAKYQDLAEQTGGDPAGLASLRTAADVGGVSIESLSMAANRLQLNLSKVDDESKGAGKALAAIGIEVNAFKQLRPDEQMRALGVALNQYADGGTKVAVIQGILGRGGAGMLSALKELGNEQVKNNGLTNEQIALADDYKDAQARVKSELLQTAEMMAVQALPAVTDLMGAFKDSIIQLAGLSTNASDLSKNKAIEEWARTGAEGIALLADAMITLVGIAKTTWATMQMFWQDAKGLLDFKPNKSELIDPTFAPEYKAKVESNLKDRNAAYANAEKELNNLLTNSNTVRRALADKFAATDAARSQATRDAFRKAELGGAGGKPKIEYDAVTGGGKAGGKARGGGVSEKISEYTRMAEAIGKVTAMQEQELAYGGKLTASAKFQFDEMQKINFALQTKKINQSESMRLIDMTTNAVAKMVEVEKQAYITDAIKKNTEAVEKQYAALASTVEGMIAANEQQRLENETIGLTTEALDAMILARQDAAIAIKQQEIVTAQSNGTDLASIALMEREIALMQTKRALTGAGQTSKAEVEAKKVAEDAAKSAADAAKKYEDDQVKIWSEINDKAESVFMDIAKNGKSAFSNLEEELKNGLLKLLYEMTVKKWIISIGSDMTGLDLGSLMGGGSGGNPLMDIGGKLLGSFFGGGTAATVGTGAASTFAAATGTVGTAGMSAAAGTGAAALAELSTGVVTLGASATAATTGAVAAGAGIGGMAAAALAAVPVIGWVALGAAALFAVFSSGKDKIPTVLNDLALFNNSLVGLPFLELAIGSDEVAQGLRDVMYGLENASPTMRKLAGETVSLSIELLRASGDIAGARNLARNLGTRGMSEKEIGLFDENEKIRDQIEAHRNAAAAASEGAAAANAAAQAENTLAQARWNIAGKLNILLGRTTQLEFDRATALAATTDEASLAMLTLTYQLEDMYAAIDASYAKLERSIAAERKLADVRLKGAADLAAALKSSKDAISQPLDRQTAQSQIGMYVALAKAGGVLPSAAEIKPSLEAISRPSEDLFNSFEDYALDQAKTANDITSLTEYADKQVTDAQKTIDALDLQLDTAKQALDVLKGVDTSVISVVNAVREFEASMIALTAAKAYAAPAVYAAPAAISSGGGGGGGYGGGGYGGGESSSPSTAGMNPDIVAAYKEYYNRVPDPSGHKHFMDSLLKGDKLMQAILGASANDPLGPDFAYAVSKGYDPYNPTTKFLKSTLTAITAPTMESYAIGSNYIPEDQNARIHKGEEITPRPYVDMQRAARDETNMLMARLVQSNEELKAEVMQLRKSSDRGNENTRRAADTLQGQQGVPFLVTIAT